MRGRGLIGTGLVLLSLSACGSGAPSPSGSPYSASPTPNGEAAKAGPAVAEDAARALEKAGAATVRGDLTVDGTKETLDLHLQGHDLSGTVIAGNHAVEVIEKDGIVYARTDAGFWTAHGIAAPVAARADGTWVIPPADVAAALTPIGLTEFADALRNPPGNATIDPAVHPATVAGKGLGKESGEQVVVVTESDGTQIDVQATEQPYPLVRTGPDVGPDPLTFTAFGERQPLIEPQSPLDLRNGSS